MATLLNIAPFAYRDEEAGGRQITFRWEEPRDLHRLVLHFADSEGVPPLEELTVEYWQNHWPEHRVTAADLHRGAIGGMGWKPRDDWFNGRWMRADLQARRRGGTLSLTFAPLCRREFPERTDFPVTFRQTLKLRLTLPDTAPALVGTEIFTDTPTEVRELAVETGCGSDPRPPGKGTVEVYNGELLRLASPKPGDPRWRLRVRCSRPAPLSYDRTLITFRSAEVSFTFQPDDLERYGPIWAPDLGVLVSEAAQGLRWSPELAARLVTGRAIYDRIAEEPEQSLQWALQEQPPKRPMHFILGCEGGRAKFGLAPNGDLFGHVGFIRRVPGRDTARLGWPGDVFALRFGWDRFLRAGRSLEEGFLPIHQATFKRQALEIEQVAFATPLTQSILAGPIRGDDPVVALLRLTFTNHGEQPLQVAQPLEGMLYFHSGASGPSRGRGQPDVVESLSLREGLVWADGTPPYVRMAVDLRGAGELQETAGGLIYHLTLPAGASHAIVLKVPFGGVLEAEERRCLQAKEFDREREEVRRFWRERVAAGAEVLTPEPDLDDFYRAHLTHILINDDFEPGSDRIIGRVSSFHYGNFSNEAIMQITDLDRRGFHEEARRHLDTYLHYQGTVGLPGNFQSQEGVFYGSGGYESGDYNQHHGWVLWGLAEHYRITGDREWLRSIADSLVAGCDWVLREAEATRKLDAQGKRVLEYGFLPAGTLEDVRDYCYWLSTNALTCRGLLAAAEVLAEVGHPEGDRLLQGARAFREDLRAGFQEAMIRSPLVRLRDGTFVPHHPSRLYWRGRDFGWIREVLEGSINLIGTVLDPEEAPCTWILKDFEDNRYLDAPYNYPLEDFERQWFSCGGFSMQPNLLYFPPPYLLRDQVEHFLRAFFNGFAACWRAEIRAMTEHPLPTLSDWAGDHFKSSDEAMVAWWLRLMFVQEVGEDCYVGRGLPRAWLREGETVALRRTVTHFGPCSVEYRSQVREGRIVAYLDPPRRRPPARIWVRFRHPERAPLREVRVDGRIWEAVDPAKEWAILPPLEAPVQLEARYG
jgi:hypothetical protein